MLFERVLPSGPNPEARVATLDRQVRFCPVAVRAETRTAASVLESVRRFTLAGSGTDVATVVVFAATPLGEIGDATIASAVTAMVGRIPPFAD